MEHNYEVVVGNIGKVYDGANLSKANSKFDYYVSVSNSSVGRAGNENVTMFKDGEIEREHRSGYQTASIQFPRLLAEIYAAGITDEQEATICESMDITPAQLSELLVRAEHAFEKIKAKL
jgi:hypothetical protein